MAAIQVIETFIFYTYVSFRLTKFVPNLIKKLTYFFRVDLNLVNLLEIKCTNRLGVIK